MNNMKDIAIHCCSNIFKHACVRRTFAQYYNTKTSFIFEATADNHNKNDVLKELFSGTHDACIYYLFAH